MKRLNPVYLKFISSRLCWLTTVLCSSLGGALSVSAQTVIVVNNGSNNAPITQMTFNGSASGMPLTLNASSGATNSTNGTVNVQTVTVNDGGPKVLTHFNTFGATITNVNSAISSSTSTGYRVFNSGSGNTPSTSPAFLSALANAYSNTNMMNYYAADFVSPVVPTGQPSFDVLFDRAFLPADYILASERNGNSAYRVRPLDNLGNPIAGANDIQFGNSYDWNIGYRNAVDPANQNQFVIVASVNKFFEGTTVPTAQRVVYGYRIFNTDEADFKFFGLSDNTFADNPVIPEPSTIALLLVGGAGFIIQRKLRSKGQSSKA